MVHQKIRFQILKRDNFTCQYCGRKPPEVVLEVDHIVPSSKGGKDDDDNLTTSCRECNRGKFNHEIISTYESIENAIYDEMHDVLDRKAAIGHKIKATESLLLNLHIENKDITLKERKLEIEIMKNKRDNWTQKHIAPIEECHGLSLAEVKEGLSRAVIKAELEQSNNPVKNIKVVFFDLNKQRIMHSNIERIV